MPRNAWILSLSLLASVACEAEPNANLDTLVEDDVEIRSHDSGADISTHSPVAEPRCRHNRSQDWPTATPEEHGLSSAGLGQLAAVGEQTASSCVVVIADGDLVGEWYWDGFSPATPIPDLWSVTKSVTSLAVGIAESEGLLDIHDPVADYLPDWQGTGSEAVTIFDLLTHTSGREWDFYSDFAILEAEDQTAYALSFGQSLPPGTRFDYSNLGVQTLEAVLEAAIGGDVGDYVEAKLFAPLGMSTASLARDAAGNPRLYTGLSASCRDLARLGYLAQREGRWRWQQVVPEAWIAESTAPATDLNDAYGYLWWLNGSGHVVLSTTPMGRPEFDGKLFPSGPDHAFMALGAFGQLIYVDDERELVMVRATLDYDMSDPFALADMDALVAALAAAEL